MKNTTDMKKNSDKGAQAKMKNYPFWLVLACAALAGLCWCLLVIVSLGIASVTSQFMDQVSAEAYDVILSVSAIVGFFVASALSVPFGTIIFKRLHIEKPLLSAIGFFMAVFMGFGLFIASAGLAYFQPPQLYIVFAVSMLIAVLVFGLLVRPLKHQIGSVAFVLTTVGLALLPIVVAMIWRYVMINSL
jgi:hypothetical protein